MDIGSQFQVNINLLDTHFYPFSSLTDIGGIWYIELVNSFEPRKSPLQCAFSRTAVINLEISTAYSPLQSKFYAHIQFFQVCHFLSKHNHHFDNTDSYLRYIAQQWHLPQVQAMQ
jgi:hypothetical protein